MVRNFWPIWIMLFFTSFCNIIKVMGFLYLFIIFFHLIFSFSFARSLLVAHVYISIELIDCILLSSFEIRVIWLISAVKHYAFHFQIFAVFLILICCFYEFFLVFRTPHATCTCFLHNLFFSQFELSFYNF